MAATLADRITEIDVQLSGFESREAELLAPIEEGKPLTDEQRTQHDGLVKEIDQLTAERKQVLADIEKKQKADERRREREESAAALGAGTGRQTDPDSVNLGKQRDNFLDDPKRGFKDHREFLLCVMDAGHRGYTEDKRLKSLTASSHKLAAGSDEQSTFSDPYGGFLIPSGMAPGLLSIDPEADPTAGRETPIQMDTPTVDFSARVDKDHSTSVSGGLRVYRRAESDTVASSRMELEKVTLRATGLFGVAYATEEVLERSPISFISLLDAGFSDEMNATMLDEKINGSGVGEFEGVLTTPCKIAVAKESGQAADTINKENIDKMRARCWRYGQAVWLYNHDCLPQLRSLVQAVGTGGSIVSYFQTDSDGNSTLDGRPAFASEFAKTIGDEGDLILANWSQFLLGTLSGQRSAESMHVRFLEHERTFKFWIENDGRWWWRSALTPRESADTLSPVVTLAARE